MDARNNDFDFDFTPIGQAIKKARTTMGMTRDELARIVDYDPRHLQAIENEGQYPSLELFIQLVTMFGVSVDEYIFPDNTLTGYGGFIYGLYRAFNRISGFNISHRKPPFPEDLLSNQSTFFATTSTTVISCVMPASIKSACNVFSFCVRRPARQRFVAFRKRLNVSVVLKGNCYKNQITYFFHLCQLK